MKNPTQFIQLFIGLVWLSSCKPEERAAQIAVNPLLGSWEMTSVHWITVDTTYSIDQAQPGILMIDSSRYSTMWTPLDVPRTAFINLSQPVDEEIIAGFRSVVFNAGTYVMTDSTLTTTALIAKVPGFEGGIQFYKYIIDENVLTLTMFDETYPNGKKPEWFGRYETKFVYKRAK